MNLKKTKVCSFFAAVMLAFMPFVECAAKVPLAHFGKNTVKLEVADTPEKIEKGLMFRRSLSEENGMVFLFHPPRAVRFWMFNCFISLDMIFIDKGRIVKISENVPPCKDSDPKKCPLYPDDGEIAVTEVVEVAAGYCKRHGIKQGDPVTFDFLSTKSTLPEPAQIPAAAQ